MAKLPTNTSQAKWFLRGARELTGALAQAVLDMADAGAKPSDQIEVGELGRLVLQADKQTIAYAAKFGLTSEDIDGDDDSDL